MVNEATEKWPGSRMPTGWNSCIDVIFRICWFVYVSESIEMRRPKKTVKPVPISE